MPRYGKRVIGERAFEAQQRVEKLTMKGRYGKRVIGEQAVAEQRAAKAEAAQIVAEQAHGQVEPAAEPALVSAQTVRETVVANPATVDELLASEIARPGGPRLAALQALLDAERDGQAREAVLLQIEDLLTQPALAPTAPDVPLDETDDLFEEPAG